MHDSLILSSPSWRLDYGLDVDVVYLDLAKAFDKVDHNILLLDLGIRGMILAWLQEFLTNRKQMVRVSGQLSAPQRVRSGVPKGSVLFHHGAFVLF